MLEQNVYDSMRPYTVIPMNSACMLVVPFDNLSDSKALWDNAIHKCNSQREPEPEYADGLDILGESKTHILSLDSSENISKVLECWKLVIDYQCKKAMEEEWKEISLMYVFGAR